MNFPISLRGYSDPAFDSRPAFRVCREEYRKIGFFGFAGDDALRAMFPSIVLRPRCSASWPAWLKRTVMPRHRCAWLVLLVQLALCSVRRLRRLLVDFTLHVIMYFDPEVDERSSCVSYRGLWKNFWCFST